MKPLQNPFGKYTRAQRYFGKPKTLPKWFWKGGPVDMQKSQCLQGFALCQNSFGKPFGKPSRAFSSITLPKYPHTFRWGVLERYWKGQECRRTDRRESPAWRTHHDPA